MTKNRNNEEQETQLFNLKQEIANLRKRKSEIDGRREYLQQQLNKHGLIDEEEMGEKIKELENQISDLRQKANNQIDKIQENYDVEI